MKKRIYTPDPYQPNALEQQRKQQAVPAPFSKTNDGLRFCEHCRQRKPINGRPHRKGWNCTDCTKEKNDVHRETNKANGN